MISFSPRVLFSIAVGVCACPVAELRGALKHFLADDPNKLHRLASLSDDRIISFVTSHCSHISNKISQQIAWIPKKEEEYLDKIYQLFLSQKDYESKLAAMFSEHPYSVIE
jgi:hypothetical protein